MAEWPMCTYHILLLGRDYGPKCDVTSAGLHWELVLFVCRSATFFSMFFSCLRNVTKRIELYDFLDILDSCDSCRHRAQSASY